MLKIKHNQLNNLLGILQESYQVFAPVKYGKETAFRKISTAEEIDHSRLNTTLNPKDIFFPQAEVMFKYDNESIKIPEKPEKPTAVWGLRACDTKSIRMLNKVFANAYQMPEKEMYNDPYWIEKYKNCLLFTTACNEPLSTCFCNWFNSGPYDSKGSDVFVVDIGKEYILKGITESGKYFLSEFKGGEPVGQPDLDLIKKMQNKAEDYLPEQLSLDGLKEKLGELWDDPIWEEISAKCVNCGACAYICPTCHCFDVSDEGKEYKGQRVRLWDSCMFQLFTKEASGHNSRALSTSRVRQRIMHKYNYFVENYHEFLCTGCGRCVQVCPVNLDIREVIKKIINYQKK